MCSMSTLSRKNFRKHTELDKKKFENLFTLRKNFIVKLNQLKSFYNSTVLLKKSMTFFNENIYKSYFHGFMILVNKLNVSQYINT